MTETPTTSHQTPRHLIGLLIGHRRWQLARLACNSFAGGLTEAAFLVLATRSAFAITEQTDEVEILGGHRLPMNVVIPLALALVLLRVASAIWGGLQSATLTTSVVADTRRELSTAFLGSSWPTQQADRTGQLQELLTTFSNQGATLLNNLTTGTAAGFSLLALLGTAIAIDPLGALGVIVGAAILGTALRPIRGAIRRRARESAETSMKFASSLNEVSQMGLEVHVFHVKDQTSARVRELIAKNAEAERRLTFARGLVSPIYTGLAYIALVAALGIIAVSNATDVAALGAVMLVMLRSLSYGQAIQSSHAAVTAALPFVGELQSQLARYRQGRTHDGGVPVEMVGRLDLAGVTFSYEPGRPALRDVTLSIAPSEVVGIVGPSGGGKSTLVQLLLGLREPDSGSITADGRPTREFSRAEWARKVTFVPQGAHLIAGTVSDNIRFLRDDVSQTDIQRAAELAHLADDVAGFVDGYDRQVGERGGHLSGGQQQRLCIARALVERPDVIILDEPTSALDVRSEHLIRQTLLQLREHMTIIIIAHRLSTLDICDRIMVIQDGRMVGFDTPEMLATTNAFYGEALTLSGLK